MGAAAALIRRRSSTIDIRTCPLSRRACVCPTASVHFAVAVRLNAQCLPSRVARQLTARFLSPSDSVRYALYSDTLAELELALGLGLSLYWVRSPSATLRGWSPTSSTALRSAFCSVIFIFYLLLRCAVISLWFLFLISFAIYIHRLQL